MKTLTEFSPLLLRNAAAARKAAGGSAAKPTPSLSEVTASDVSGSEAAHAVVTPPAEAAAPTEGVGTTEDQSFVIEQGEAYALNRSAEGILLFMGRALREKQLIEVHTSRSRWGRTANVYEVRWSKPIRIESGETLYLVGGRRIFGPWDYVSF